MVSGTCNTCGACCRRLSLEGSGGWLRSEKDFETIKKKYQDYRIFDCIGKDTQGFLIFSCSWCSPEGLCLNYSKRLPLCKNFPEKSLKFSGGSLPPGCGYTFAVVEPFEKILKKQLKKEKGK